MPKHARSVQCAYMRGGELRTFKKRRNGDGILCTKHLTRDNDVWYDCDGCLKDANAWADANGFTQCVSPYITEDGTDNGQWVLMEEAKRRWINNVD